MHTALGLVELDKNRNVCYQCCPARFGGFAARGPDAATTDAATADTPPGDMPILGLCTFAARCGGVGCALASSCTRPAICARSIAASGRAGEAKAQARDQ